LAPDKPAPSRPTGLGNASPSRWRCWPKSCPTRAEPGLATTLT